MTLPARHYFSLPLLSLLLMFLHGCSLMQTPPVTETGDGPVRVDIPATVLLLAIDGRETRSPSLYQGSYILRLPAGQHTLLLQYEQNWNRMDEAGHIIRSVPVQIDSQFVPGTAYRIQHPAFSNRDEAQRWSKAPDIRLQAAGEEILGDIQQEAPLLLPEDADTLKTLQSIWQQASDDEKSRFRLWIEQQP